MPSLSWCRAILQIPSVPRRLASTERGIATVIQELQALSTELQRLSVSHQALHDAVVAADAERKLVIEELQRLGVSHDVLTQAVRAAEADRRRFGERIESAASRTDGVARASAKALGVAVSTVVDTQKELLDVILEKNIDRTATIAAPSVATRSAEAT